MQVRNFFSLYRGLFFLLVLTAHTSYAQKVSTNANGDKIVVFDDGSWRYFNPNTDSALENEQAVQTANDDLAPTVGKAKQDKSKKVKKTKVKKAKKNKKPKKAKKAKKAKKDKSGKKQKKPKKIKQKKVKKNKSGKKKKKGKKSKGKKIVKAEPTPAEIQRSEQLAFRRAESAAIESAKLKRVFEDASLDRVFLEKELQDAYGSLESTDSDIAEIESRLQVVRNKEKVASDNYTQAEEKASLYAKMMTMSYGKREKLLQKMALENMDESVQTNPDGSRVSSELSKEQKRKAKELKMEREKMDVMLFPPQPPCNLAYSGIDEFSGKIRKEVAKELFFSFTSDKMKPYFKEKDYLTCKGGLSSISGGVYSLNLEIEVASESAQREFGFLEKGAVLIVKMIDGSSIRLVNRKTDMGSLNPLLKSVVFKPQYLIGANQVKDLSKGEVDKVRIVWSLGYDDYEIYELDFFKNQFRCLEEK